MSTGELLVRGTAWLSLLGWAASEWLKGRSVSRPDGAGARLEGAARAAFTAGGLFLLVHAALALHVHYGWSHQVAARETARQTRAVTGLAFEGGLLVNEVFLVLWSLEALWWWRAATSYRSRGRAVEWPVRAFFFVMFASGAFVFVRGPMRLAGAAAVVAVAVAWYRAAQGEPPEVAHG
jgi:hypothetical protein